MYSGLFVELDDDGVAAVVRLDFRRGDPWIVAEVLGVSFGRLVVSSYPLRKGFNVKLFGRQLLWHLERRHDETVTESSRRASDK